MTQCFGVVKEITQAELREEYPRRVTHKDRVTIPCYLGNFDTVSLFLAYLSEELTRRAKERGYDVFAMRVKVSRVWVREGEVTYELRRV
jgi:hypothetical protein